MNDVDEDRWLKEEYELRERYCQSYQHINLELSDLSKFPDRIPLDSEIPYIDDEPQADDAWIKAVFERFDRSEVRRAEAVPLSEEDPHIDNVITLRGKHFMARKENPKYETLGGSLPKEAFVDQLTRITNWENVHNPIPTALKLDDLNAVDYNKVYAENTNIKLEQIEFAPMGEDLWLTYRRIEGAYYRILVEAHLAGKQATEYRPLSPYPAYHDALFQLRNRIHKATGIGYQKVSRGLNHMLKKDLINAMRTGTIYLDAYMDDWNRTNFWQMNCEKVIEAREKHGKDWIKKDPYIWWDDPLDDGQYIDRSWQHWRRYTNEHNTLL